MFTQNIRKIRICTRNTRNASVFGPKHVKNIEFLFKICKINANLLQIIRKVSKFSPKHWKSIWFWSQNIWKVLNFLAKHSKSIVFGKEHWKRIELLSKTFEKYLISAQFIRILLDVHSKHSKDSRNTRNISSFGPKH